MMVAALCNAFVSRHFTVSLLYDRRGASVSSYGVATIPAWQCKSRGSPSGAHRKPLVEA